MRSRIFREVVERRRLLVCCGCTFALGSLSKKGSREGQSSQKTK